MFHIGYGHLGPLILFTLKFSDILYIKVEFHIFLGKENGMLNATEMQVCNLSHLYWCFISNFLHGIINVKYLLSYVTCTIFEERIFF